MNKPIITINGVQIEMLVPKARMWREFIKFDEERKDISSVDFVDRHSEIIAQAFGVSKDDVLDNLSVDEILPAYTEVLRYLVSTLTSRFVGDKKNDAAAQT